MNDIERFYSLYKVLEVKQKPALCLIFLKKIFRCYKEYKQKCTLIIHFLCRAVKWGLKKSKKVIFTRPTAWTGMVCLRIIRQKDFLDRIEPTGYVPVLALEKFGIHLDKVSFERMAVGGDSEMGQSIQSCYKGIVTNAIVSGSSNFIVSKNLFIYNDLLDINTEYTSEELHGKLKIDPLNRKAYLKKPKISTYINEAVSFTDACAPNYSHWLTEVLSRVALWHSLGKNCDIINIFNRGLPAQMYQSLVPFLVKGQKVLLLDPDVSANVATLHVASSTGYVPFDNRYRGIPIHHGFFQPYALNLVRKNCLSFYAENDFTSHFGLPEKVYIKRQSAVRNITNAAEVEHQLKNAGFTLCDPGNLTFAQQVTIFANAKHIIAPTGAACANIIFARHDSTIQVFMPEHPDTAYGYWDSIGRAVGVDVQTVLGKPETGASVLGRHCHYSIDLSALPI
jgi:hypothetical protein